MDRSDFYQKTLIASGLLVTLFFSVFFYRELFPEYKIYQEDYVDLEQFRATYTGQPPPEFKIGIKQIVLEREDKGPATIDRCTSCHVALQIPYFSPTRLAHDINGNIVLDAKGVPVQIPNEDYIWTKLDQKIADLKAQGDSRTEEYERLKTAKVGEQIYDVTKVLKMHPLIGKETRPFEFHPIEEYGCTSCHNGNGRGLTTSKAHGPVFDGQYEKEFTGHEPQFLEIDSQHDPKFSQVFNGKPGDALLFQTQPIFVGALIQAKCMQCHQTTPMEFEEAALVTSKIFDKHQKNLNIAQNSFREDLQTLIVLLSLKKELVNAGYSNTLQSLEARSLDYDLTDSQRQGANQQHARLRAWGEIQSLPKIDDELMTLLGSPQLVDQLYAEFNQSGETSVDAFLVKHKAENTATGRIFERLDSLEHEEKLMGHVRATENSLTGALHNHRTLTALTSDVDELTSNYQRGKELFLSQACYACHRISGLARGGVGPELTNIGNSYPWYIKESIVWPQADVKNSTMPNMRLDHTELQDLMSFLLAQKGQTQATSNTQYKTSIQSWEAGRKLAWEKPLTATQIYDLRFSKTLFATEGCAACHRLQGFESDVGFKIEQQQPTFEQLYKEHEWFRQLFPEIIADGPYNQELSGSEIIQKIEAHGEEIDVRIVDHVRQNSILEEIDLKYPEVIESFYSNFRFASRSKPEADWKARVHRVLMTYIQVYGLGRLIGPQPNWSGVYHSDEWLMEHFRNPSSHVPRSIMPVMPFDDTRFYALTNLLDHLGILNRNTVRKIWDLQGFNPAKAFEIHCVQCHGLSLEGNGPVSEWIYPIPKNLRNSEFLRNLTKKQAIHSIVHGVKGTPMAPWGEVGGDKSDAITKELDHQPVLTEAEIEKLVDWLFSGLAGSEVIKSSEDVPKWHYEPEDIVRDLKKEGNTLESENKGDALSSYQQIMNQFEKRRAYASLIPYFGMISTNSLKVEDLFDVIQNPLDSDDLYYIKKKYYTKSNIEEGQALFTLNCAVCHGNEADGSGARAQTMREAKPRMLTNLDWLNTHDDLRLLRSIKYGVPGTSMTPWGDVTSTLQRLQLVIFIRSLSEEKEKSDQLNKALYRSFDEALFTIETARTALQNKLDVLQKQLKDEKNQQSILEQRAVQGKMDATVIFKNTESRLTTEQEIHTIKQKDLLLIDLKTQLKNERAYYQNLGIDLNAKISNLELLNKYMEIILLNQNRYSLKDQQLQWNQNEESIKSISIIQQQIIHMLNQQIHDKEHAKTIIEGKVGTQTMQLEENSAQISTLQKLKIRMITDINDALRSIEQQKQIFNQLKSE